MIGRWADSLHLFLLSSLLKIVSRGRWSEDTGLLRDALRPEPDPFALDAYTWGVFTVWLLLTPLFGLAMVGAGTLSSVVGWHGGRSVAFVVGSFFGAFSIVGTFDALWRYYFARAARRRYTATGAVDDRARSWMQAARLDDGVLVWQLLAGAFLAWRST